MDALYKRLEQARVGFEPGTNEWDIATQWMREIETRMAKRQKLPVRDQTLITTWLNSTRVKTLAQLGFDMM